MNKPMITLAVGLAVGTLATMTFYKADRNISQGQEKEKKPLYWVAPMDPNYRRNEPGTSPMGMDLVPVYEDADLERGAVYISPEVTNNLGVKTSIVERKAFNNDIVTVGHVQYDEEKIIHIHPRVSGWVEQLHVKAMGNPVKKGAPLYALYSPELVNAQEELILALNNQNTRLIRATEDRMRSLQIPETFIQTLKRTKKIENTVTFYAPQDGVVDHLGIREGFFVEPGTTMLSIGALDQVWVEAEIFERQSSWVQVNDQVTMTLDYLPNKKWSGQVDYIYPALDNKTRTLRLRLRFDNPDEKLKPNMYARIVVHPTIDTTSLILPRESLIQTGNQNRVVLALGDGKFKSVEVKVGQINDVFFEVLEGLVEGERVVTSAHFLIDSESSKTSDFKRMDYEKAPAHEPSHPTNLNHSEHMQHQGMDHSHHTEHLNTRNIRKQ